MVLLSAAARVGVTDWASSVMSTARLRGSASRNACALSLGGLNLERAPWYSAVSILTGVENSSMECSPSKRIFVQHGAQERKEDTKLARALCGICVRAVVPSVLIGPLVKLDRCGARSFSLSLDRGLGLHSSGEAVGNNSRFRWYLLAPPRRL